MTDADPTRPPWCSGDHCTAHDGGALAEHRSAPAVITIPLPHSETIKVSITQIPGGEPWVEIHKWSPGDENGEPEIELLVPAVVAKQFDRAVAAAVAAVTESVVRVAADATGHP